VSFSVISVMRGYTSCREKINFCAAVREVSEYVMRCGLFGLSEIM
jgi:hypothetical protein